MDRIAAARFFLIMKNTDNISAFSEKISRKIMSEVKFAGFWRAGVTEKIFRLKPF